MALSPVVECTCSQDGDCGICSCVPVRSCPLAMVCEPQCTWAAPKTDALESDCVDPWWARVTDHGPDFYAKVMETVTRKVGLVQSRCNRKVRYPV